MVTQSPKTLSEIKTAGPNSSVGKLDAMEILVVDDMRDNQRLLTRFLARAGAVVHVAENGEESIAAVAAKSFDAVVMDIQMPVLDGYEATKRLRALGYRGFIVALTGHAMAEEWCRCLAAGCNDALSKPVDNRQLIELLATSKSSRARVAGLETSEGGSTAVMLREYVTQTFPETVRLIAVAIESRDCAEVARYARVIGGSIAAQENALIGAAGKQLAVEAEGAGRVPLMRRALRELVEIHSSFSLN